MSTNIDTHITRRPTISTITGTRYLTKQRDTTRSTSSSTTDNTSLTLPTSTYSTQSLLPAKSSQTNNIGARPRRPSFAKATTSKFVNMVPSLSNKMADKKEQSDTSDQQRRQRRNSHVSLSSVFTSDKENSQHTQTIDNDLTLSYRRLQSPSRRLSIQVGATQSFYLNHNVDNAKYNNNKHRSVLNPTMQSLAPAPSVPSSVPSSSPGTTVKKQYQRLSRDLTLSSPALIQPRRLSVSSKQNKTETSARVWPRKPSLRVATPPSDSNSDSDDGTTGHTSLMVDQQNHLKQSIYSQPQHHHQHHQHHTLRRRRTSITSASLMTHTHDPSLMRRRSLADISTSQEQRLQQAQARLRHPSWLDSAGFMRQSKCAACNPEPPTPTSVLSPPIGIGVPAFGLAPDRRSLSKPTFLPIDPSSTRSSLAFTKDDSRLRRLSSPQINLPRRSFYDTKTTTTDRSTRAARSHHRSSSIQLNSSPSSLSSSSTAEEPPSSVDVDLKQLVTQLVHEHRADLHHDPDAQRSLTAMMMDDLLQESDTKTLEALLTEDPHRQVNSVLSSATLVDEQDEPISTASTHGVKGGRVSPDPLADLAAKVRSVLGRWFTDLNHGRLERYDTGPDGSITTMTITGFILDSHVSNEDRCPYTLSIGPEERKQVFRIAPSDQWTADDQVMHCQFKTKASQCDTEFDWVNRRHHCRRCGDIFCKVHSMNRLPLFTDDKPNQIKWSRICDSCCHHLISPYLVPS